MEAQVVHLAEEYRYGQFNFSAQHEWLILHQPWQEEMPIARLQAANVCRNLHLIDASPD